MIQLLVQLRGVVPQHEVRSLAGRCRRSRRPIPVSGDREDVREDQDLRLFLDPGKNTSGDTVGI